MQVKFCICPTRAGHLAIVATPHGLKRVYLPETSQTILRRRVKADFPAATEDHGLLPAFRAALRGYFDGRRVAFDVALDWQGASPFQTAVWRACRKVRYGATTSYRELAARVGRPKAARAVGLAMSRNPLPIVIPCHRVLRSDGSLGGYSGAGGVILKQRLLDMEAAAK